MHMAFSFLHFIHTFINWFGLNNNDEVKYTQTIIILFENIVYLYIILYITQRKILVYVIPSLKK